MVTRQSLLEIKKAFVDKVLGMKNDILVKLIMLSLLIDPWIKKAAEWLQIEKKANIFKYLRKFYISKECKVS